MSKLDIPSETAAVIYRANGKIDYINPKEGHSFTAEELKEMVGGKIEIMTLLKKFVMIFNENCRGEDSNLVQNLAFPQFYGDVVICKVDSFKNCKL
jgi:hypothetical protein